MNSILNTAINSRPARFMDRYITAIYQAKDPKDPSLISLLCHSAYDITNFDEKIILL